jgi:hypothetical protein
MPEREITFLTTHLVPLVSSRSFLRHHSSPTGLLRSPVQTGRSFSLTSVVWESEELAEQEVWPFYGGQGKETGVM